VQGLTKRNAAHTKKRKRRGNNNNIPSCLVIILYLDDQRLLLRRCCCCCFASAPHISAMLASQIDCRLTRYAPNAHTHAQAAVQRARAAHSSFAAAALLLGFDRSIDRLRHHHIADDRSIRPPSMPFNNSVGREWPQPQHQHQPAEEEEQQQPPFNHMPLPPPFPFPGACVGWMNGIGWTDGGYSRMTCQAAAQAGRPTAPPPHTTHPLTQQHRAEPRQPPPRPRPLYLHPPPPALTPLPSSSRRRRRRGERRRKQPQPQSLCTPVPTGAPSRGCVPSFPSPLLRVCRVWGRLWAWVFVWVVPAAPCVVGGGGGP
jgi:hypothetical protein